MTSLPARETLSSNNGTGPTQPGPGASYFFWMSGYSPHISGLADAINDRHSESTYIIISPRLGPRGDGWSGELSRHSQGWPTTGNHSFPIKRLTQEREAVEYATSIAAEYPDAIHIQQGLRGQPLLPSVLKTLCKHNSNVWCLFEQPWERPIRGFARRVAYRQLIKKYSPCNIKYLAIGSVAKRWLLARRCPLNKVFEFAYFLPPLADITSKPDTTDNAPPQTLSLVFVGQLIKRKRVDLILKALHRINDRNINLTIIGSGPEQNSLSQLSKQLGLTGIVSFTGVVPMDEVRSKLASYDYLVLPSDHDGWGAVISESLLAGTPVICSSGCGAASTIRLASMGQVFKKGDVRALEKAILTAFRSCRRTAATQHEIRQHAAGLTTHSGATYLRQLVLASRDNLPPPPPPWA